MALLDDTVDPDWDGLGKFMSGQGWPMPSESIIGRRWQTPFYASGRLKHGDYMARLITRACPFVQLFIAKIDTSATDATVARPVFYVS